MESNNIYKYPKLKGSSNYKIWKLRTELLLLEKGYTSILYLDSRAIIDENRETIAIESQRAVAIVRLTLEDGPLIQTEGAIGLESLLSTLKTLYDP